MLQISGFIEQVDNFSPQITAGGLFLINKKIIPQVVLVSFYHGNIFVIKINQIFFWTGDNDNTYILHNTLSISVVRRRNHEKWK